MPASPSTPTSLPSLGAPPVRATPLSTSSASSSSSSAATAASGPPPVGLPPSPPALPLMEMPTAAINSAAAPSAPDLSGSSSGIGLAVLQTNLQAPLAGSPSRGINKGSVNRAPVRQSKPKGSRRNIAMPISVQTVIIYAEKADVAAGEDKPVWAIRFEVHNGYPIISSLTDPPYPFEHFRFDGSKQVWYSLVKSEKMYHALGQWVEKVCADNNIKYIDQRGGYQKTLSVTEIALNIGWEGEEDNGKDVEWLTLSGEIWYLKSVCKDFGGRWDPRVKIWDSVSIEALPQILKKSWDYGYPLTGNFNWDGRATSWLGMAGAYLQDDVYEWHLHKIVTAADDE